jgi:hypothetical protein
MQGPTFPQARKAEPLSLAREADLDRHLPRDSGHEDSSSTERPARRRRKKDCRHCRTKAFDRGAEEAKRRDELAVYEERSAELRAIFGLPDLSLCRLGPGCLSAGVVYAIGCNGTDCGNTHGKFGFFIWAFFRGLFLKQLAFKLGK